VKYWAPVLVWAGVIFSFSTDHFSAPQTSRILGPLLHWLFPDIAPEQVSLVQFAIRKLGHWVEYFILSALLLQAFHGESKYKPSFRSMAWTLALMFIYAVGDELHQSFVPNRSAGIDDVMIDTFGGACGALWMYRRLRRR